MNLSNTCPHYQASSRLQDSHQHSLQYTSSLSIQQDSHYHSLQYTSSLSIQQDSHQHSLQYTSSLNNRIVTSIVYSTLHLYLYNRIVTSIVYSTLHFSIYTIGQSLPQFTVHFISKQQDSHQHSLQYSSYLFIQQDSLFNICNYFMKNVV